MRIHNVKYKLYQFSYPWRPVAFLVVMMCLVISLNAQPGPLTETQYRDRVTTFVYGTFEKMTSLLLPGTREHEIYFAPCRNGTTSVEAMRSLFMRQLLAQVSAALTNMIDSRSKAVPYFGNRSLDSVMTDCQREIRSAAFTKRIDFFIAENCTNNVQKNNPPKADAGPGRSITLPENSVQLDGKGTDSDPNDRLTFRWTKASFIANEYIVSPNSASTRVENLSEGIHRFMLTVTDSRGASDTAVVVITVNPPQRRPPTANAGNPLTITLPTNEVTLNGSGTDPNGSGLNFRWTKISGGAGQIVSETNASTRVTGLRQGTYQFRLTVTNKYQLSASAYVQVMVNEAPNSPPQAFAGDDVIITLPRDSVRLSGYGTDADGDQLRYHWKMISGPDNGNIHSPGSPNTLVDKLLEGEYYFALEVSDGHNPPVSANVRVRVNHRGHTNLAPTAHAGKNMQLDLSKDSAITLQGSGTDSDGTIVLYKWEKISGPKSYRFDDPNQALGRVEDLAEGKYLFQLTVMDNDGATGSDIVMLNVIRPFPWKWILIALAGICVAAVTWRMFRFLFVLPGQKVIAYYLDEQERALVDEYMPASDKTEGYSVGHLSRSKIRRLKKKGIVMRVLDTTRLIVHTPGIERHYKFDVKQGKYIRQPDDVVRHDGHFESIVTTGQPVEIDFPAFYLITLDSPLLPKHQAELDDAGITVLQRVPYDSYIVVVSNNDQLQKLEGGQFKFIRVERPYSTEDKGFMVLKEHSPGSGSTDPWVIDLMLHREKDGAAVRDFLGANRIDYIDYYRNVIRIIMPRSRELALKIAANKYIQAIHEFIPPTLHNDFARKVIGLTDIENNIETSCLTETGQGELIAVADSGIDRQHPDLADRIRSVVAWGRKEMNDTSDPDGHGTHVTGTIVGTGAKSNGSFRGIAPGAQIFFQSLLTDDNKLLDLKMNMPALLEEAFKSGAKIINLSWGAPTDSAYTLDSCAIDQFVFDNPEMLVVVSAGNYGAKKDEDGNVSPLYGSVGSLATNRNGLTVGITTSSRNNGDVELIPSISSRGPCNDFRVKPDLIAPGTSILSVRSSRAPKARFDDYTTNPFYAFLHGSSMAAPIVTGAAALVREYYRATKKYNTPQCCAD